MDSNCSVADCRQPPAGSLGARAYCREHFISTCYQRIEECAERLRTKDFSDAATQAISRFLIECTTQVTDMALRSESLDNLERSRLLDILLWTSEISRCVRRSARKQFVVPVRLESDRPGAVWEEETETRVLSRYGALIPCAHSIEVGRTLRVVRKDTGRKAQARVISRQSGAAGGTDVAVEFLDSDNFWEMEW